MAKKVTHPSVKEGFKETISALKLEIMELVETALKKLESGLSFVENEIHQARVTPEDSEANTKKVASKKKSSKREAASNKKANTSAKPKKTAKQTTKNKK